MSYSPTTQLYDPNVTKYAQVDAQRGQKMFELVRLVGRAFDGTTKDTNFWSEAVAGTGSVTQNGTVVLNTGATANSTVLYQTVNRARFIAAETNECRILAAFTSAGVANNVRRVGCYTTDVSGNPVDGLYFELNGTTFSVNHVVNGVVVSTVANGSFNGLYGATWTFDTSQHRFFIEYTGSTAYFSIDNTILHTMSYGVQPLGINYALNGTLQSINSNGLAQSVQLTCWAHTICRLGVLQTQPRYRNITAAGTYNLKYGPGVLRKIILGGAGSNGATCIVYDDTAGTTTVISTITVSGNATGLSVPSSLDMDAYFQTGLKVVVTGTVQVTFIWE